MNYDNPSIADVLMIALVGFAVVFVVLVVLMGLIKLMSVVIGAFNKPSAVSASPAPAPTAPAPAAPVGLRLENVSEKEAAMIMAIVADELGKDPAELNFISIKEVK